MLTKTPTPTRIKFVRKAAAVLFVVEGLLFAGSFGIYYKLNTDRDFRRYTADHFPAVLNWYYRYIEKVGPNKNIREIDYAYWTASEN